MFLQYLYIYEILIKVCVCLDTIFVEIFTAIFNFY